MMSLNDKIKIMRDALNSNLSCDAIYHYWRLVNKDRYVIWAEDFENTSFRADNNKEEQEIHGTIDLFTKTEYDPLVDEIQNAIDAVSAWRLNSVQYEDETGYIHYEWEWSV